MASLIFLTYSRLSPKYPISTFQLEKIFFLVGFLIFPSWRIFVKPFLESRQRTLAGESMPYLRRGFPCFSEITHLAGTCILPGQGIRVCTKSGAGQPEAIPGITQSTRTTVRGLCLFHYDTVPITPFCLFLGELFGGLGEVLPLLNANLHKWQSSRNFAPHLYIIRYKWIHRNSFAA